ncbi:ABC transporter permease [Nocardioides massiliensis]|uniref:Peptide/nickel transport system permease protein n=1 Tax=Nocardioides massiliensis TaxID=1325935 RepID=A0ABT9NK36_9ACTN|nr:ABC transporter permease [Nocardioides massiliensis]MDP9820777.1 peptide/nickel transport system permease protein [Nocardioides massiliensis]
MSIANRQSVSAAEPVTYERPSTWRRLRRDWWSMVALTVLMALALVSILAPWVAPYDPAQQDLLRRLEGPSGSHWLGTDEFGRDQLSRLIYGSRLSILASLEAVGVAMALGIPLGLIGGYVRGRVDAVLSWFNDGMMAVPTLVLALTIVAALGPGLSNAMIAVGLTLAPRFYRVARASTAEVRESPFIEASRSIGCGTQRIMWHHVLPNAASPIIVQVSVMLGMAILAEASISFLGIGARPPDASWGTLIQTGSRFMTTAPTLLIAPGVAMLVTVLALQTLGDGLRDALGVRRNTGKAGK